MPRIRATWRPHQIRDQRDDTKYPNGVELSFKFKNQLKAVKCQNDMFQPITSNLIYFLPLQIASNITF